MSSTRYLLPGHWRMDFFPTRLAHFFTQRTIRWLIAVLLALLTFWGLIIEDDVRQGPSFRRSDEKHLAPRSKSTIKTPGAIAGLVLGIVFGLILLGCIVWRSLQRRAYGPPRLPPPPLPYEPPPLRAERTWPIWVRQLSQGRELSDLELGGVEYGNLQHIRENLSAFAPSDIWKPTDLELGRVSREAQSTAFSLRAPTMSSMEEGHGDKLFLSSPHLIGQENAALAVPDISNEIIPAEPRSDDTHSIQEQPQSQPDLPKSDEPEAESPTPSHQLQCPEQSCSRTFDKQYKLNHHMRYHQKTKQCPTCSKSFGTVTHLERHINSAHLSSKIWHCSVEGCKYSAAAGLQGNGGFARKDNWRRHMKDKHGLSEERD